MADHTPSLFKGNPKLRDEFEKKYNQLLSSSLPPIVDAASTVDGWFEDQWQELLVMAKQGLACPDELQEDGDVVQMELTQTFEAELRDITELKDEEEMERNHDNRVVDRKLEKKQKAPGVLAWKWLVGMHAKRTQWAHCYKFDHMTFRTFSTQRIESWHAAFKHLMGTRKKILDVCKLLDIKWEMVWNEGEELHLRRSRRNALNSDVPIVAAVSEKLSNEGLDRFRAYHVAATKLFADKGHILAGEQVYYVAKSELDLVSLFYFIFVYGQLH